MVKKPYETGKSKLVKKMAEKQGEPAVEVTAVAPVVAPGLPQAIEGVNTQVFADACKVILADEIKAAQDTINTLKDERDAIGCAYAKKAKVLVAVWVRSIRKDIKEVLVKHSVATADESDNRCYGAGRVIAALGSKPFLEELCPFAPGYIRLSQVEESVLPEALRGDRLKYLEAHKAAQDAVDYLNTLRGRAKDIDTEVARYRLSEGEGMTPAQYEKVKAMLLRKG